MNARSDLTAAASRARRGLSRIVHNIPAAGSALVARPPQAIPAEPVAPEGRRVPAPPALVGLAADETLEQARLRIFSRLLGQLPTGSLVDLGTGHGRFAVRAAHLGWQVTGVDARADRLPEDPRVTWLQSDLRALDLAPFDVVSCLGVFYHLDLDTQHDLLAGCAGRPLVLDTAVDNGLGPHRLGPRVTLGSSEGGWYREPRLTTSSWDNRQSFWHTEASLYRLLGEYGYREVLTVNPWYKPHRTFFLAVTG